MNDRPVREECYVLGGWRIFRPVGVADDGGHLQPIGQREERRDVVDLLAGQNIRLGGEYHLIQCVKTVTGRVQHVIGHDP